MIKWDEIRGTGLGWGDVEVEEIVTLDKASNANPQPKPWQVYAQSPPKTQDTPSKTVDTTPGFFSDLWDKITAPITTLFPESEARDAVREQPQRGGKQVTYSSEDTQSGYQYGNTRKLYAGQREGETNLQYFQRQKDSQERQNLAYAKRDNETAAQYEARKNVYDDMAAHGAQPGGFKDNRSSPLAPGLPKNMGPTAPGVPAYVRHDSQQDLNLRKAAAAQKTAQAKAKADLLKRQLEETAKRAEAEKQDRLRKDAEIKRKDAEDQAWLNQMRKEQAARDARARQEDEARSAAAQRARQAEYEKEQAQYRALIAQLEQPAPAAPPPRQTGTAATVTQGVTDAIRNRQFGLAELLADQLPEPLRTSFKNLIASEEAKARSATQTTSLTFQPTPQYAIALPTRQIAPVSATFKPVASPAANLVTARSGGAVFFKPGGADSGSAGVLSGVPEPSPIPILILLGLLYLAVK